MKGGAGYELQAAEQCAGLDSRDAFCGADSLGGFWVAFVLAMAVFVWKFFNLTSAFPEKDNDNDGWDK